MGNFLNSSENTFHNIEIDKKLNNLSNELNNQINEITNELLENVIKKENILPDNVDLNTVVESGMYRISTNPVNAPEGAALGLLLVIAGADTIAQIVVVYNSTATYIRSGNPLREDGAGSWLPWKQVLMDNDVINNLTSTLTNKPLSAAQGKVLNDQITNLTSKFGYGTWLDDAHRTLVNITESSWSYSVHPNNLPTEGLPEGYADYGTVFGYSQSNYKIICYVSVYGEFAAYSTHYSKWTPIYTSAQIDKKIGDIGSLLDTINRKVV